MARETINEKAARYLLAGKVSIILRLPDGRMRAAVNGDTGVHLLGYDPRFPGWRCLCPAYRRCSHVIAVEKITGPPPPELLPVSGQDARTGRLW